MTVNDAPKPTGASPRAPSNGELQRSTTLDSRRTLPLADAEPSIVQDDPYHWTPLRKNLSLFLIFIACVIAGIAANIQNPAVEDIQEELFTTSEQLILSLSVFVLVQGLAALVWCAISEVKGRKLVYLVSLPLFTIASIGIAISKRVGLVIGFRAIQAAGLVSSAVIAIGAVTLTDIFEPPERGTKIGIYSVAPLLGPALSPIVGGSLTAGLCWRSISWFLSVASGLSWLSFLLFFRETFRKERSPIYQTTLLKQHPKEKQNVCDEVPISPNNTTQTSTIDLNHGDLEKAPPVAIVTQFPTEFSVKSANPLKPVGAVLRRTNNLAILLACSVLFALTYLITYTSARTLATFYNYHPLMIGAITITYGFGCVFGSLMGGRWSDNKLSRLKETTGGKTYPEMRLKSTTPGVFLLPPCIIGFGWACERQVHVAALCALLFVSGFFTFWIYASTLAYLTDANTGRSATAMATHSAFRGVLASISIAVVVPTRDALGDGWFYTVWGIVTVLSGILVILVSWKGEGWRRCAEEREAGLAEGTLSSQE